MSLKKIKFNKFKARRTKLSNRNKIEHLYHQLKKLKAKNNEIKAEKNVLVQQHLQDNGIIKEKLNSEEEKVKDLKKQIECPVCLEVPRKGPVYACLNGHLVCQNCKRETCPTCREAVGDNKSLVAVAVIERVLHDCKFVECEKEFALKHIEEHEKNCEHRVVACPYYKQCDQRVSLSKILEHFERNACGISRALKVQYKSVSEIFSYKVDEQMLLNNHGLHWKIQTVSYMGSLHALCVNKLGDNWQFIVVTFETPEFCAEFNIEMEVYEADSDRDTRLSARIHCHPSSIDEPRAEMEGLGLCVHHRFMKKMALKEDGFKFMFSLTFF